MRSFFTKVVIGVAALAATATVLTTAAHSQGTNTFNIMSDDSSDLCGFALSDGKGATVAFAYSAKEHSTIIGFTDTGIPDLTDKTIPVSLVFDNDQFDMNAIGRNGGIIIVSTDAAVPAALKKADLVGLMVSDTPIFAIESDQKFDSSVDAMVACSQNHK